MGHFPTPSHVAALVVWGLLLVLACSGYRRRPGRHERLLVWAFSIGLLHEAVSIFFPMLHRQLVANPRRVPMLPVVEGWMSQAATVILVGAFLTYLGRHETLGRRYILGSLSLVTAAFLGGALAIQPATPGPPPVEAIVASGLATSLVGFGLAWRFVQGQRRIWMLTAIAAFVAADAIVVWQWFRGHGGPPALMASSTLVNQFGALLFGYIYIREQAADAQSDIDILEERVRERTAELREAHERLLEKSTLDPLTLVRNRAYFDRALNEAWEAAERDGSWVAVALVDIDQFKSVNDSHGHQTGDDCLVRVAQALRAIAGGERDVVARYGGDEFLVLLPDTDPQQARAVLEAARDCLAALHGLQSDDPSVTISAGVAACRPGDSGSPQDLVRLADAGLYQAKRSGRNQVKLDSTAA